MRKTLLEYWKVGVLQYGIVPIEERLQQQIYVDIEDTVRSAFFVIVVMCRVYRLEVQSRGID